MSSRRPTIRTLVVLTMLCASVPLAASDAVSPNDLEGLRQEVRALKENQDAMAKTLADIQKQIASAAPKSRVRAIDATLKIGASPTRGRKDAAVTLVEFSDYQCPFCRRQAETTIAQLEKDYVETGKIRYVLRDFPLQSIHGNAAKAAEAAHCAGEQDKYWDMHAKLFESQQDLATPQLRALARAIGVDAHRFDSCLDSEKYAALVKLGVDEGDELGVGSTPTAVLGRTDGDEVKAVTMIVGALPYEVFKQEIDKLLATPSPQEP